MQKSLLTALGAILIVLSFQNCKNPGTETGNPNNSDPVTGDPRAVIVETKNRMNELMNTLCERLAAADSRVVVDTCVQKSKEVEGLPASFGVTYAAMAPVSGGPAPSTEPMSYTELFSQDSTAGGTIEVTTPSDVEFETCRTDLSNLSNVEVTAGYDPLTDSYAGLKDVVAGVDSCKNLF